MAPKMPNMKALLALLAIAGYKNRDKISEMLSSAQESIQSRVESAGSDTASTSSELNDIFSGNSAGGALSGGLNDLFEKFNKGGHKAAAESWVGSGANQPVQSDALEQVLGNDLLSELAGKTGMSKQDILSRLASDLPGAVDGFTPDGRLPSADEASRFR